MGTLTGFSGEEDVFLWESVVSNPPESTGYAVWKKFKQERQSERSVKVLYNRFHRILLPKLLNTKFHPETKLQLCKSHKIPVDGGFLKALQTHADIELDTDNRVISFTMNSTVPENKDAELDHEGILKAISRVSPALTRFSEEEDDAIWRFVTVDLQNHSGTIPWVMLKRQLKSTRDPFSFSQRFFCHLAPTLHCADFDVKTKLKLYKKYQIPVDKNYVDILKSFAVLEIDENRRIQSYQINVNDKNDVQELDEQEKENCVGDTVPANYGTRYSPEEDMQMWKFAIANAGKLGRLKIWKDFKIVKGSRRSVTSMWDRFSRFLFPNLRNTKFHTETKLKLCKLQREPVDEEFLEELEKDAIVILDSQRIVESFTMKPSAVENKDSHLDDDSFLQICSIEAPKRSYFTSEEDLAIWKYLIDMIHVYSKTKSDFWELVRQEIGPERSVWSYNSRFHGYLAPNLHKYNFDVETKLKLYRTCQIAVDKDYLELLQQHAYLKLEDDERIVWYKMKGEDTFEEEDRSMGNSQNPNFDREVEYKQASLEDAVVQQLDYPGSVDGTEPKNMQKLPTCRSPSEFENIEHKINNSMDSPPAILPPESLLSPKNPSQETEKENDRDVPDDNCPKITEEVTREEELNIWNYILEKSNCETGSRLFWRDYLKSTIWKSNPSAFMERFEKYIVPNLHKTDLDLKTKLALYKKCQNPVNKQFLKKIPEDVSVKLDENECLTWYKLATKKPKLKKRCSSPEYRPEVKKPKKENKGDEPVAKKEKREKKEKDDELVVSKIVPGTGVQNPDKIILIPPKVEIDDSEYVQVCDNYGAAGFLQPKEEIVEQSVNWNQSYQMPPEMSAMIAGYVDFANAPLRSQIANLSESLHSLEKNVLNIKRKMSSTSTEESEGTDDKEFLINFKKWIAVQKSSKMEEIDRRVDAAIHASNEIPEDLIFTIFDNGLKMIGH